MDRQQGRIVEHGGSSSARSIARAGGGAVSAGIVAPFVIGFFSVFFDSRISAPRRPIHPSNFLFLLVNIAESSLIGLRQNQEN
jgi:hypothetical protein